MAQNRLQTERIDVAPFTVKPMSHNVPGYAQRMKAHRRRVQKEYLDFREIGNGRSKNT